MKTMVIVKGRGTEKESRTATKIPLYYSRTLGAFVTIPTDDDEEGCSDNPRENGF